MRGLKLFVRIGESPDVTEVKAFLQSAGVASGVIGDLPRPSGETSDGSGRDARPPFLIGKLLGDLVAVLTFELEEPEALRVDCILVRDGLRRKRIGRVMMRELETIAAKLDRPTIVINDAGDADGFFRSVGFRSEGERWVKFVAAQSS